MNSKLISQEGILSAGKELVAQGGITALSIRTIAQRCNISVGSVYNYFPSKGELLITTIESIWQEIIYDEQTMPRELGFSDHILYLFNNIQKGFEKYPAFFTVHPMSLAQAQKKSGRAVMQHYFTGMKDGLLKALQQDPHAKKELFSDTFTPPDFVDFIFSNILTLLMQGNPSCDHLLEIVRRVVYEE
ncbi:MAG: TetR/AcrR family transcriptional regulator [Sphaerochaeta sp.]|nr:TetR/AcrR family transcriptional regulator [Sphaerochaeta sp.]